MTSKGCISVYRRVSVKGVFTKEQTECCLLFMKLATLIDALGPTKEHLPASPVELYRLCIYEDPL